MARYFGLLKLARLLGYIGALGGYLGSQVSGNTETRLNDHTVTKCFIFLKKLQLIIDGL